MFTFICCFFLLNCRSSHLQSSSQDDLWPLLKAFTWGTHNIRIYQSRIPNKATNILHTNITVAYHEHVFMEMIFPDGCGFFQKQQRLVQEWLKGHNIRFRALTWWPNSPDVNPVKHLSKALGKQFKKAPPQLECCSHIDTTAHLSGVLTTLIGHGCFNSKHGTNTMLCRW